MVTVSSIAATQGKLAFDDVNAQGGYKPMYAYGVAKLPQLMFAVELDQRSGRGAVVDAVGPADAARVVSGNIKKFLGI